MSGPTWGDALAWLDNLAKRVGPVTGDDFAIAQMVAGAVRDRAAVAELIAADEEFDSAMRSEADTNGMLRREAARVRRSAALARVRGGA